MTDASVAFELLDERLQQYLWTQQWAELRPVQEQAIRAVLHLHSQDVLIAASTASGKTEAAFLPILTRLRQTEPGGLVVYVSPLKALINDQHQRLTAMCDQLDIPVWPWHGDVSATVKKRFLKSPSGVLLITPEALEATLCTRGFSAAAIFATLQFVVIDELHAFIGTERGKQLQSLLHRIEKVLCRRVRRVALSATLGDVKQASAFLRQPGTGDSPVVIDAGGGGSELKVVVKGYEEPPAMAFRATGEGPDDEPAAVTPAQIAVHLYESLRGSNNLVFPNSRREVERYTRLLNELCDRQKVRHEFWPHHGSLSKELRADTEAALKQRELAATAICTNTLELGIDIGAVKSVAQVGAPSSVSSLRQRLGRSGRRKGEPAILRAYCSEASLAGASSHETLLRTDTVQMAALVRLLVKGWYEPPRLNGLHLSTLVQQVLALIAQNGGTTAMEAHLALCGPEAPFATVLKADFVALLRHLGAKELIQQDAHGELHLGRVGEAIVGNFNFYSAFTVDEEYRLVHAGQTLGTLPVDQLLKPGQRLVFGGKPWAVEAVEEDKRVIVVSRARGGAAPLFSGHGGRVHREVRQEMRRILESPERLPFLDATATRFVEEARAHYKALGLGSTSMVPFGDNRLLFTWEGDDLNEALVCLLQVSGFNAWLAGPCVEISLGASDETTLWSALESLASGALPSLDVLLADVRNIEREKWDWALPPALLRRAYASLNLDLSGAQTFLAARPWKRVSV